MFQGMSLTDFIKSFKTEDDCKQYLYDIKWKSGFICRHCAHEKCWPGRTRFHARCRQCNYDESVTAHTAFHRIQFSLLKAFFLAYHETTLLKSVSSRNLAELVGVNPKTALYFAHKVRRVMGDWVSAHMEKDKIAGNCPVDSIIVTHRGKDLNGLQKVNILLNQSRKCGRVRYIHCKAIKPDESTLNPCHLVAGKYVDEAKNIIAWNFKTGLTGVHHHCSDKYQQNYLDEYSFKFCHRNNKRHIWHSLIRWMVVGKLPEFQRNAA
ncbi:MAG: transposase [Chitinophagaceae bacterium]|nr:MAG: transposase [Chitinophagaceae bacterium]